MSHAQDGGALLSMPPTFRMDLEAERQTVQLMWRFVGVILIAGGTLYFAIASFDLARGDWRGALAGIGAVASLMGGILLLAQRYESGPDTVRKSGGVLGLAIGTGVLTNSLQNIGEVRNGGTDPLALLTVSSLVLGSLVVLMAAISLSSRRYAAWYRRRWDARERRRIEKLMQWR